MRRPLAGERQREPLDDASRDVILHPEQIAQRRLHRVRGQQRPFGRLDELRGRPQLIARAEQRAHHHAVDIGFDGEHLDVRRVPGKSRGGRARSHDQRSHAGQ